MSFDYLFDPESMFDAVEFQLFSISKGNKRALSTSLAHIGHSNVIVLEVSTTGSYLFFFLSHLNVKNVIQDFNSVDNPSK